MNLRLNAAGLATSLLATVFFSAESRADYIVNGGETLGTYRIRDDGSTVGYYLPPSEHVGDVETYGEDFAVTPDLSSVCQFTNSLGMSTVIFAYEAGSRNFLPEKVLHSGFATPPIPSNDDFIANARLSLIRPSDPLGRGDLFTVSGSVPFIEGLTPQIKRYNRASDSYVETIDPPTPQMIRDFAFGPDNRLYMAAQNGVFVYEDSAVGLDLVSPTPLLGSLTGKLTFGPDGHLYLSNPNNLNIERYTTDGAFVDTFANAAAGDSIQFGVDGNLHVLAGFSTIKKYDGTTGNLLATIVFGEGDPVPFPYASGRITYLPIPEPSSLLLATMGAALVVARRRRSDTQD